MPHSSLHQLSLLADHLKLSLLERQRALVLNLEPNQQDGHISRSLNSLEEGLQELEEQTSSNPTSDQRADVAKLRKQYVELYSQFHGSAPPSSPLPPEIQKPNDPDLTKDFEAAQSRPVAPRRNKSVRFRDDPNNEADDPEYQANQAALFSDQDGRYRDEPDGAPDQTQLDNQQIHQYHRQVLRDQDEQLDALSESIGRQRMIGIQMGNELDEQNELLEDVEGGVDRHLSTLERARRRLGHVARKSKDNWSWLTIGILIVILVLVIAVLK